MTKRRSVSSVPGTRAAGNAKHIPDSEIDFSDIPESTDEELKRARRVGRPRTGYAKDLIAIRISPRLLQQLRRIAAKQNKPYQTLIHELLEAAAAKHVA
jgi:predicted DNA binding CopG/RHH family protein